MSSDKDLGAIMHSEPELQMVGFYLGTQEFTVPTIAVQEVIRYETPAKLPASPKFVAGVINLRGKMTPLVYLRDMLEISQERKSEDRFIIVCRRKGLQFGLIIERVHTMYRVPQKDIDWGIEAHLGVNIDLISGLLKLNGNLVPIVSVDRIVDYVLEP
jgi:purine-binding chemotaxis protein CheW